jgi:glutamyl-tRNA synthetase
LHVGGIRTALFAWLIARQAGGQFVLRIEDTDKVREVAGSDQHIKDSLMALGLGPDEDPWGDGPMGPYRQSQRLDIYKQWADKLVASGRAYADPYSAQEVEAFRNQAKTARQPFLFRNHRPLQPPKWDGSQPLRFRSQPQAYKWHDAVMGDLSAGPEAIDDFILIKSDGYPTYNFAHIVDDHLMKISHVIRSQEFLASVPKYLNLYDALGLEPPILATVPFVLGPDGKKKLSKRDGAKDVLDYIRQGYLPDALVNFIASLGWNDGSQQEIFSRQELIAKFSLERVQTSGARFDEQRLLWMNGAYIRQLPLAELSRLAADFWPDSAATFDDDYRQAVLALTQERLKFLAELPSLTNFFFEDLPVNLELIDSHKQLRKFSHQQLAELLKTAQASLQKLADDQFTADRLADCLNQLLAQTEQKPAVLFSLIRVATTQAAFSPGLADTLAVLGKERSLRRLNQSLQSLA